MALLAVAGLTKHFGGVTALENLDLSLEPGEIFGLIGPNGAGKTTLFNVITGFEAPTAGRVIFQGTDISGLPPHRIANAGVIRTYQKTSVFPQLTVLENLLIGRHRRTSAGLTDALFRTGRHRAEHAADRRMAEGTLAFLDLQREREWRAGALPYGLLRKLEIAIALMAEPIVLCLDEPAAGLNPTDTHTLREAIARVRTQGVTIILVEHNMELVMNLCERIAVLNFGRKLMEGPPAVVQSHPEVVRVYLGEAVSLA